MSLLAGGLALLAAPAWAHDEPKTAPATGANELVGVWQARTRFGPDLRGELSIRRDRSGWRADIAGRRASVQQDGARLSFRLSSGAGGFRGRQVDAGHIRGHWIQPRTVSGGMAYATPVELTAAGPDLWRGEVKPLDDALTLYLDIHDAKGDAAAVFLRNPERNLGYNVNLESLVRHGDQIALMARPNGAAQPVQIATASYDADEGVISMRIPGRGGFDFTRADADSDIYPRPRAERRYAYAPPTARTDGWPVSTLNAEGLSQAGIEQFVQMLIDTPMDSIHAQEVHGMLIARHGKLVLEEYFHGEHADKLHDTRSAAKSLTSVLIGAEIQDGAHVSAATPVYATMLGRQAADRLEPHKQALTLEHLLTMSSGFDCDDRNPKAPGNEDVMQNQDGQPDWYRYALDLPMAAAPGAQTVYCSTNPNLAGGVLAKAAGEPLEESFDRLVARPLQFGRYALDLQPTGEPYMGGGAQFLPRDFMKLGQLTLDGGVWHGRRIVSRDWAARSTSTVRELRGHHYGYLWWGLDFPYKGGTVSAFYAAGNGGQVVMAVPALDLVIAIYGGNYGDKVLYVPQEVYAPKYILPAVN